VAHPVNLLSNVQNLTWVIGLADQLDHQMGDELPLFFFSKSTLFQAEVPLYYSEKDQNSIYTAKY